MRVAVLGMGHMGRAVAERLLGQGFDVTVWNRTPGRVAGLLGVGATEAPTPRDAARDTGAVLMSLADDRAVLDVMARLTGRPAPRTAADAPGGAPTGSGPVVVDMSTVSPATSRRLRDAAPGRRFTAAPIMGGPQAVVAGEASGLLGGHATLVERLEPLWTRLFSVYWQCGDDPGAATAYKLLNNYLLMSGVAALAEAVATAEAAGLDPAMTRRLLSHLPTVAPALGNRLDDLVGGDHRGWFATRLGAKDVRLFAEVAEAHGVSPPLARLVERRYEEAAARGWAEADIAAVVELLRAGR
ncbi:NAD(P)-dependent oxidoreductase [Sphaerisporangium sp. TRM90804]|uniref:NAD(P)-dependent oxidoreductase n=1 Tax=Sphaerisporangium sp. TRM90804 TaxID=3031113 RepID=UPI002449AA8E|nr:NAD(P)-dependent oxidoreductase [Sphaerisporangium sp. TRM90804]MDH2426863.1 NAD(P)-dependent oxidoreductase [Sphaerisporangium sp. TRM90804]